MGGESFEVGPNETDATCRIKQPSRLGEMLIREGFVTSDDVQTALAQQASGSEWRLGRILVRQGAIDDLTLTQAIASQFHVPIVELHDTPPRPSALALLPREAAFQLQALPLSVDDDHLSVAVADPPTRELRVTIERATGMSVRLVMCPADELAAALEYWYSQDWDVGMVSVDNPFAGPVEPAPLVEPADPADARHFDDQIINWLLSEAERQQATAVHLDRGEDGLRIRYRLGEQLVSGPQLPCASGTVVCHHLLAAANLDPSGDGVHEGDFHAKVNGRPLTCRVAAVSTSAGTHVVLQTRPRSHAGHRLEDVGIHGQDAIDVRRILEDKRGVVVAAGVATPVRNAITRTIVDEIGSEDHAIAVIGPQPGLDVPGGIGLTVSAGDPGGVLAAIHTARVLNADAIVIDATLNADVLRAALDAASQVLVILTLDGDDPTTIASALVDSVSAFLVAGTLRVLLVGNEDLGTTTADMHLVTDDVCRAILDIEEESTEARRC